MVVELGEGCLGARDVVTSIRVQIPPLLLVGAHTSEVDLGAWFVEVDSLQGLSRSFHRRRLFLLLGLNVVQCIERHHQDSGLTIIISLRQMSLSLLLLLAIWALPCPMAHLPVTPAGVGVDLILLLQRSLAAALAIATAAGGGFPGLLPGIPLLLCHQQLAAVRRCCGLLHALIHRPQMTCHILNGEG